jgi:dTDP-glucose pyrophosphorylase
VNRAYLERGDLYVQVMGRGFAWFDTGTHASLVEASHFVQILEQRQGLRLPVPKKSPFVWVIFHSSTSTRLRNEPPKAATGNICCRSTSLSKTDELI